MTYEVHVLYDGYSKMTDEGMVANCTCTLIKGPKLIIVDTMTPWDKEKIITGLGQYGVQCSDVHYVVCTHGHSDHTGNNNLFLNAKHIVGFSISCKDMYFIHPFETGEPFIIDEDVKVVPTPGHTLADVSVLVNTKDKGLVSVTEREQHGDGNKDHDCCPLGCDSLQCGSHLPTFQRHPMFPSLGVDIFYPEGVRGDLFEREEDITNPTLWQHVAGSDDPHKQQQNRNMILKIADWIVPGHGPMFKVTEEMKNCVK